MIKVLDHLGYVYLFILVEDISVEKEKQKKREIALDNFNFKNQSITPKQGKSSVVAQNT